MTKRKGKEAVPAYKENKERRMVIASKRRASLLRMGHEYGVITGCGVLMILITEGGSPRCYATGEFVPDARAIAARFSKGAAGAAAASAEPSVAAGTAAALPALFATISGGGALRLPRGEHELLARGPLRHVRDPFTA